MLIYTLQPFGLTGFAFTVLPQLYSIVTVLIVLRVRDALRTSPEASGFSLPSIRFQSAPADVLQIQQPLPDRSQSARWVEGETGKSPVSPQHDIVSEDSLKEDPTWEVKDRVGEGYGTNHPTFSTGIQLHILQRETEDGHGES